MARARPNAHSSATPASAPTGADPMRALAAGPLANQLIAANLSSHLADDLVAAHAAGIDFLRANPSCAAAVFRNKSATARPTLLGLFMGRPEARRTAARVQMDLMGELSALPGIAAETRQFFAWQEARLSTPFLIAPIINASASRSKAGARTPDSRENAQRFIAQMEIFVAARASWEAVARRVFPLFTLAELFQARLAWSSLLTLPAALLLPLFDQAALRPQLWNDSFGHAPLATLCEMQGDFLSRSERSALIGELRARKSLPMGIEQNNPYFTLANQVVNPVKSVASRQRSAPAALDQELWDALFQSELSPIAPSGRSALDLACECGLGARNSSAWLPWIDTMKELAVKQERDILSRSASEGQAAGDGTPGNSAQTPTSPATLARRL